MYTHVFLYGFKVNAMLVAAPPVVVLDVTSVVDFFSCAKERVNKVQKKTVLIICFIVILNSGCKSKRLVIT